MLRELGIPVIFEREGIDTMSGDGELLLSVLASIAQEEINNMSQNISWAHERNNAAGNPVIRTRYGYRKEREGANATTASVHTVGELVSYLNDLLEFEEKSNGGLM